MERLQRELNALASRLDQEQSLSSAQRAQLAQLREAAGGPAPAGGVASAQVGSRARAQRHMGRP